MNATDRCRCGHMPNAHEHWRAGSDCATCPVGECGKFRAVKSDLARAVTWLLSCWMSETKCKEATR